MSGTSKNGINWGCVFNLIKALLSGSFKFTKPDLSGVHISSPHFTRPSWLHWPTSRPSWLHWPTSRPSWLHWPEWDFMTTLTRGFVLLIAVILVSMGFLIRYVLSQPDAVPTEASPQAAAAALTQVIPSLTPIPLATDTPMPTPIPVFRKANAYLKSDESPVPKSGRLSCRKGTVVFTQLNDSLTVTYNGRTESILSNDYKFTSDYKWAVFDELDWGITYWDPATGSGQTSMYVSGTIVTPVFLVDDKDHDCIPVP